MPKKKTGAPIKVNAKKKKEFLKVLERNFGQLNITYIECGVSEFAIRTAKKKDPKFKADIKKIVCKEDSKHDTFIYNQLKKSRKQLAHDINNPKESKMNYRERMEGIKILQDYMEKKQKRRDIKIEETKDNEGLKTTTKKFKKPGNVR